MDKKDLLEVGKHILAVNMALKADESALIVTDTPRIEDWQGPILGLKDLVQRAVLTRELYELVVPEFPACQIDFLAYPTTGQNGTEPPEAIAKKFIGYDVLLLMTTFSITHTDARVQACKNGSRVASMPGIEESMLFPGGPVLANAEQILRETTEWAEKINVCKQVRVMTSQGTDLSFSIEGRAGGSDHGLFHKPGLWGNLPAGEAYTSPVEGTANGRLVAPAGWYPGLRENLTLIFENGYVTSATGGGEVGDQFRSLFHFGEDEYLHRRNCAELGIGTNPNAKNAENVLEAEKIRGTIHIAVGDSAHMMGKTVSDLHEDFVIPSPELYFDGKKVMG
jgi:leucyl aminopeptidase (aminopeptidase T)